MKNRHQSILPMLSAAIIMAGCSHVTEVSTPELVRVVETDGVPFNGEAVPQDVIDRLSQNKVLVLGEIHFLREHRLLVAELIRRLHDRGFRQLLFEWPQMADWVVNDYVKDGGLWPGWNPPISLGGDLLEDIRAFNRTLEPEQKVEVHGIDVNLDDYGGAQDFLALFSQYTQRLSPQGVLTEFFQRDYGSPKQQREALESLRQGLRARRNELIAEWGQESFDVVTEVVEVELVSVGVRALRADRYDVSARLRENAMKRITELRLENYEHGTLVNVGANHAQKKQLKGTDQEWLGDYLAHASPAAGGSVSTLNVGVAQIIRPYGVQNILAESPTNEIFRVMNEAWPDQTVFLPLDDPIFCDKEIPMVSEGTIYQGSLKEHYDAFVLIPIAQQVPLN